ncbi:hypothetical protein QF030_007499 [Streptomyces rishiriensis]|uniref:Uncharacterized protein n=1 Tax=Streptomyces rishiriensis TaxID=68264 RepID=A0ABU0P1Q0_STRRH|nr:hypothetical protein [Streptomyces rishiriensis]
MAEQGNGLSVKAAAWLPAGRRIPPTGESLYVRWTHGTPPRKGTQ